jgi:hypothetical protein
MSREYSIDLEAAIINELSKLGMTIPVDRYGNWHWLEKEMNFENNIYLIGAFMKRDEMTKALEIHGQQCLLKQ